MGVIVPQLFLQTQRDVEAKSAAAMVLDNISDKKIRARMGARRAGYEEQRRLDRQQRGQRYEELQIRHGKIKITMDDGRGGEKIVGPVQLSSKDSIDAVQQRVHEWLNEKEPTLAVSWPHGVQICVDGVLAKETAD